MRVDEIDDALDAVRNRRGLQIEVTRPRDCHMGDGPVYFEKLQAMRGELLAQRRDDLERETLLLVPGPPHQMAQRRRRQLLGRSGKQRVGFDCANNVAAMYFAEML